MVEQTGVTQTKAVGDISGDDKVNLADAMIALKIVAGMDAPISVRPDYVSSGVDINGDDRVGMAEVIYVLQNMAGLR